MKDMQQEKHVAGYTLRTFLNEDSGDSCVQILRNGAVVHQETNTESFRYTLGQQAVSEAGVPALADGIDLTGNGYPNVIVTVNTRGAHCCLTVSVYELSAKPKRIAELKVTHTEYPYFKKGSDGVYRFYARDWSLAYWPSSFAGSPSAPVVLRYTNHGYHLDLDAMRTPRPSLQDMQHAQIDTKELFQDFDASQSGVVWAPVMQWIYGGHDDLAWKFVGEEWPPTVPGKEKWTGDFCSMLVDSPYWHDLQPFMTHAPTSCTSAAREEMLQKKPGT